MRHFVRPWFVVLTAALAAPAGCTGSIAQDETAPPAAGAGPGASASGKPGAGPPGTDGARAVVKAHAPARVRRLTAAELKNAAADVLLGGEVVEPSSPFPAERQAHKFDGRYDELNVSLAFADSLQDLAQRVTTRFAAKTPQAFACGVGATAETACVDRFLDTYGLRLYRRPLLEEERSVLREVFTSARAVGDFQGGLQAVTQTMLQSPGFLFRTELGDGRAGAKVTRLGGYEIASALSFTLWATAPDAALLDAAARGKLDTAEGVRAEAERLLADARARRGLDRFVTQWLEVDDLESRSLDSKAYPAWSAELAKALLAETSNLGERAMLSGTHADLFTATTAFVSAPVAKLYGATAPAGGAAAMIALDPSRRAGFLTQAGFLAAHAPAAGFSPVLLGRFFRTKVLCQTLPPPPPDVTPLPAAFRTTRERYAQHSSSVACSGCHRLMDPIGFGLERYDALGGYHETENGSVPLTQAGEIVQAEGIEGRFVGPVELARKLAQSPEVPRCLAAHWLEYALGRGAAQPGERLDVDEVSLRRMLPPGATPKTRDLVLAALVSESFLMRDASAVPTATGGK